MKIKSVKRRPVPDKAKIAARVTQFRARDEHTCSEGVRPLNAGFFQLERMRAKTRVAKRSGAQRRQPRT